MKSALAAAAMAAVCFTALCEEPAAAPDAAVEGFGAASKGGEGGRLITVTTLADSGPGSLREALAVAGPRIVRFGVEGSIELKSRIRVTSGRLTLDGSTAPGAGVVIRNYVMQFAGDCDDIILRHIRTRVTTGGDSGDCLCFWGKDGGTVERVLVDHCSLMGATDEAVNTWGKVRDVTVQWTIIAEARLPHSKGWLSGVGSDRVSIHHCLFAQNADRNPKLEGGFYDVVNCVVFNWSVNNAAKVDKGARVNFVNNVYIPGPASAGPKGCFFPEDPEKGTKLYLAGNFGPHTPDGAGDQWQNVTFYDPAGGKAAEKRPAPDEFRATEPFAAAKVTVQGAKEAMELVLERAGARVRDEDDLRVVQAVRDRKGSPGRPQGK
jgi:hypothetical protein